MGTESCLWEPITSSIDWCEVNCEVSPLVAEFWNTISNGFIILPAVVCFFMSRALRAELRFQLLFSSLTVVGIGSFLFHATLTRWAQILDEVPMIVCGSFFVFSALDVHSKAPRWFPWFLCGYSIIVIYGLLFHPDKPVLFQGGYIAMAIFTSIRCVSFARSSTAPHSSTLFYVAIAFYFGGALLWLLDYHVCHHLSTIPMPLRILFHWHSGWHLGTGYGSSLAGLFIMLERQRFLGKALQLEQCIPHWWNLFVPRIVPSDHSPHNKKQE